MQSIRNKFFTVMLLVVGLAILAYMVLAIQLFNKDKSAYVFDSNSFSLRKIGLRILMLMSSRLSNLLSSYL